MQTFGRDGAKIFDPCAALPELCSPMLAWARDRFSTVAKPRQRGTHVLRHGREWRVRAVR